MNLMSPRIEKLARFFILARNRRRRIYDRGADEGETG